VVAEWDEDPDWQEWGFETQHASRHWKMWAAAANGPEYEDEKEVEGNANTLTLAKVLNGIFRAIFHKKK
jgi:hypothetical protein